MNQWNHMEYCRRSVSMDCFWWILISNAFFFSDWCPWVNTVTCIYQQRVWIKIKAISRSSCTEMRKKENEKSNILALILGKSTNEWNSIWNESKNCTRISQKEEEEEEEEARAQQANSSSAQPVDTDYKEVSDRQYSPANSRRISREPLGFRIPGGAQTWTSICIGIKFGKGTNSDSGNAGLCKHFPICPSFSCH